MYRGTWIPRSSVVPITRTRVRKVGLVHVSERLAKRLGWDQSQGIELDRSREVAELRAVFEAMTQDERDRWLERFMAEEHPEFPPA